LQIQKRALYICIVKQLKQSKMTTTQINNRIAELNQVIANSLNDTSINGAKIWADAHKERETLKNMLCK